ncbi:SMP-30/gluconolactonase/LRE family protein [Tunicatimonas pelagia]|uniref:SMP-30/gluconolactonase/LRE family protein n=1 Tax=Tunicatimonas pelagia TaxID=931531 RepID=UPI0026653CCF|nr:SMP-30/gluconolactonase/LRE family protein [Tunicatimonas pelagia]WKN40673.1 SMP-30/gluconolactonase/LRE family protein [Tunicatimonas pelagia]
MLRQLSCLILSLLTLLACSPTANDTSAETTEEKPPSFPTIGSIDRLEAELDQVVPPDAQLELLAEGFDWSEGPVWVSEDGGYLLFSDIPPNRVYKWQEGDSISLYLEPAGFSGDDFSGKEPGSNGLLIDGEGNLVLCQHGNRQMARMNAPLDNPESDFVTIVGEYEGKRLNSPNDAVFHSNGDLYFTDPPYGLPGGADSKAKELDFQGVYRFSFADSSLTLLTQEMTRPNGIALSPDEKTLYVANSDPKQAIWMAFDVLDNGTIDNGRIFYDATDRVGEEKGLPDGMVVHSNGYIFATGPGGVWIFSAEGQHLGTLKTGQATANCTLNNDESALYITADMYLIRLEL